MHEKHHHINSVKWLNENIKANFLHFFLKAFMLCNSQQDANYIFIFNTTKNNLWSVHVAHFTFLLIFFAYFSTGAHVIFDISIQYYQQQTHSSEKLFNKFFHFLKEYRKVVYIKIAILFFCFEISLKSMT